MIGDEEIWDPFAEETIEIDLTNQIRTIGLEVLELYRFDFNIKKTRGEITWRMGYAFNKTDLMIVAIICDETNNIPEIIEQHKCVVRIDWLVKNDNRIHSINLEI